VDRALFALFLMAFAWALATSWQQQRHWQPADWQSDLRADAAGYYVYLPGLVHHGMHATGWPDSTEWCTGHGFRLDAARDRVETKYTYGTALLMAPFYFAAEILTGGESRDGLTDAHRRAIECAAAFYWSLALLLLASALLRRWPSRAWLAIATVLLISFGSNTVYYVVRQPGYSHAYSFFAMCAALWALLSGLRPGWRVALFQAACALIILIRPVDAIAVTGLHALAWHEARPVLAKPRYWILLAGTMALFALPQLAYWHHVHGEWFHYSYGEEGFTQWSAPAIGRLLLAPGNGWVPNAPVLLAMPFALAVLLRSERTMALAIAGVMAVAVYATAAWHQWHYGCGFGARPLVQYMPMLALPLYALLRRGAENGWRALWWLPIVALLAFVNHRAMLQYGICYPGDAFTDWGPYWANVRAAFLGGTGN
jgi:hypothetical protein